VTPDAPSAADLEANSVVQAAFTAAWADSLADDSAQRHEEGGWIYCDAVTGQIHVRRALPGERMTLDLSNPPMLPGCYLVATYHTHPNPTADGWIPEPSDSDRTLAAESGVPWFIVSDMGVYLAGPDRRVGGLTGPAGYPV
jgi:hypothetical protein